MKKYKTHIVWVIIVVAALVGGFFWGKSTSGVAGRGAGAYALGSSTRGGFAGRTGAGGGLSGGFVTGQVTAIDADSITLQLANGNSENVFYSSSTQVIVPQAASISSVQPGTMIMVGGTANSDGSLTASSIQVRNGSGGSGSTSSGSY